MKVKLKVDGKIRVFDSFDTPIAVLLTSDAEIENAKKLGGKGRAIGSFPQLTPQHEAQMFLIEGWGDSYKVSVDAGGLLAKMPLPKPPLITPETK